MIEGFWVGYVSGAFAAIFGIIFSDVWRYCAEQRQERAVLRRWNP